MTGHLPLQPKPKRRCANPSGEFRVLLALGTHVRDVRALELLINHSTGTYDSAGRWPKILALISKRKEQLQKALDEYEGLVDEDTPVSQQ